MKTTEDNIITINLDKATDEEALEAFFEFYPRVQQLVQLVENDDGVVVAKMLITFAGDKAVYSDPIVLDWPLQKLEAPEVE